MSNYAIGKVGAVIKCLICGKPKYIYPYQFRLGFGKYCSRQCHSLSLMRKDVQLCRMCGKSFYPYKNNKFCSVDCVNNFRIKNGSWNKGKKSELSGVNHYNWRGGITPIYKKIRHSLEYRLWREAVFERDGYACIWCGDDRGGNLNADHIKPFADYPELRFAIDNGRTLCEDCHKKTLTFGNHVNHGRK